MAAEFPLVQCISVHTADSSISNRALSACIAANYAARIQRHMGACCAQVRKDAQAIDMSLIQEAMDKRSLGLPSARLPDSEAKTRMATVQAARAVATALTPGLPPLVHCSIQPRGGHMSRIIFLPQVPAFCSPHTYFFINNVINNVLPMDSPMPASGAYQMNS